MTVFGIDANASKIAIVWKGDRGRPEFRTYKLVEGNYPLACAMAQRAIWEFIDECDVPSSEMCVFLEAPVMGVGGPGATIPQAYVEGAIMGAFGEFDIPVRLVNNQRWKKQVLGRGGIPKIEIVPEFRKQKIWPAFLKVCPIVPHKQKFPGSEAHQPDQDIVDAAAIHLYGEWNIEFVKRVLRTRERNLEAVA